MGHPYSDVISEFKHHPELRGWGFGLMGCLLFQDQSSYITSNFVFSRPNFVFTAEFRLQDQVQSLGPSSVSGPNFVFRAAEFRLQG